MTIASYAVMNASGIDAASVKPSGVGMRASVRARDDDVLGVRAAADDAEDAIADRDRRTPSPTASTSPASSIPGMSRGAPGGAG